MIKVENNQISVKGDIDTLLSEYIQITDCIAEILSDKAKKPKGECLKLFLAEYIEGKGLI